MDACPPLEDIAAFLDGMLLPEERERVTAHLARCESCYEIFVGAAEFQEVESSANDTGGGGVFPFPLGEERKSEEARPAAPEPSAKARRTSPWLPLAASILLTAGLGFFAWQLFGPVKMVTADLIEPLQGKDAAVDSLYGETVRGAGDEPATYWTDGYAFLTGVYFVDFSVSVRAKDSLKASESLQSLGSELEQIPLLEGPGEAYRKEAEALKTSEHLRELAQRLPKKEKALREHLTEAYDRPFSFGLWAEAGRLSAATRSPAFFKDRNNRRFLSLLRKDPPVPDDLREQVLGDLQSIESLWGKDFPSLEKHFKSIIKAIDGYEDDFSEEPTF